MASFKRIRFFECDQIEDLASSAKNQPKGRTAGAGREDAKTPDSKDRTIQDLQILHMIYLDMFFLFLGKDIRKGDANAPEQLFLTKNLQIKSEFRIHHETMYVDKFINYQKGMKLLISMGKDNFINDFDKVEDSTYLIKIWDFQSLVHASYIDGGKKGLTGGTVWQKSSLIQSTEPIQGETPKMIPIYYNGKPYMDQIKAFRVSKDACIAAVALKTNEILIYRLIDPKGDFIPEKVANKPVRVLKIKEPIYQDVIDLQIFKKIENGITDYCLYLISTNGVLVYYQIEKKEEYKSVIDESNLILSPNCSDCNSAGILLVDAAQKHKEVEEHYIKRYRMREQIQQQALEGKKDLLRFFKDHVVEVKQVKNGQQLSIYDFNNQMTLFCNNYPQIPFVEVEEDAIYILTANQKDQKTLFKLHEMEDNVKIQTLLKKGLFAEAQKIAQNANFPSEIIAEICKEHADNLYEKKQYNEALDQFIKTIGYLNPSYVIQRYIEVPQLHNLIRYLEELIETPNSQRHQANLTSLADYNKDYTALLLNCYVKTKQKDKITKLIEKATQNKQDTIFDVATAIEVCRQQQETLEQAEELAEKSKQWKLLVQIQIENRKDPVKALKIIDANISNLKEKVECLQLYAPKLFKSYNQEKSQINFSTFQQKTTIEQIQQIVRNIVGALIEFTKHQRFMSESYKKYELKKNQKIRIEDLLQIFVDDINQMKDFLYYVIETYGEQNQKPLEQLTSLNLYHRLLECYLYLNQSNESQTFKSIIQVEQNKIVKDINAFIERYDSKVDKHYVLFLFQIYNYSEGVQGCCERLDLKQELLSYYIQKKDVNKVLAICEKYTQQGNDNNLGDLWIQALTFFRDLESPDSEDYLQRALQFIGEKNILSPLLVLEIIQSKKNLKFKVMKKYLLDRLGSQDKIIKKNNKKVDENMEEINKMKQELVELKTSAKSFNQKECSLCDKKLQLPTIHFMCGHTYHDYCVESEGKRKCPKCSMQFQEIIDKKEQFHDQAKSTEQFFKELNSKKVKFNVIANYFGRGLFTELDQHLQEVDKRI